MLELVQSLRGAVRYATSLECLGTSICHFRLITIWMTNCESVRVAMSYFSCLAQEHRLVVCAAGWIFCIKLFYTFGTILLASITGEKRQHYGMKPCHDIARMMEIDYNE